MTEALSTLFEGHEIRVLEQDKIYGSRSLILRKHGG